MNNCTRCGFVTLVGRPNVGKSSILNRLVNEKISIISHKPQTTRHQIQGVKTQGDNQIVYVDTPGIHQHAKNALNRYMNKTAKQALHDVDLIVFTVEALKWTDEDEMVLTLLKSNKTPVILAVNKIDKVADKSKLLPYLQRISAMHNFEKVIPLSALKDTQVDILEALICEYLPESPFFYEPHQKTNQSFGFQMSELVREQLMHQLNQELPYSATVEIEKVEQLEEASENRSVHWQVHALIWVEKPSQKIIIIGEKGERLKAIGRQARLAMNRRFNCRVDLRLWVKVKAGWSDNASALPQLGYHAE